MDRYRVNTKVTTSFALFTSCKIIHNHFLTYQWTFYNLCADTQFWNKLLRDLNLLKIEVFWDVMPWRTVCSDWYLDGTNIRRNSITISQSNGRYVPQDLKFQDTFYYALSLWSVFFFLQISLISFSNVSRTEINLEIKLLQFVVWLVFGSQVMAVEFTLTHISSQTYSK